MALKSNKFCEDFPVDIVYLWCDSNDANWRSKKNTELEKQNLPVNSEATDKCRFLNNDELKFSLRSLEKFAPWIRNIFIITDNQIPHWLDTNNPKVKIINHEDIMPQDALPTFNSMALETVIHKIPDLSEHFLYANDDMFFGNFVDKNFFFDKNGLPIYRFNKRHIINKKYRHLYGFSINLAYKTVKEKFGKTFAQFPHHNIDAYRKSDIAKCQAEFSEFFEQTRYHQFRQKDGIQRSVYGYYAIAKNLGNPKIVDNLSEKFCTFLKSSGLDSLLIDLKQSKFKLIEKYRPHLFCINDCNKTTPKDRFTMKKFLEEKFPQASEFEKPITKTAQICVCYHKEFDILQNEIMTPIQVGAAISDTDLGICKDSSGDNISDKNKTYCELTALYWLWKNSNADFKGLMHYRRLMDLSCGKIRWYNKFPKNILDTLALNKNHLIFDFENYDLIVPMKRVIQQSTSAYEYYRKRHYISDLDRTLEIINEKSPEIYQTAIDVLKNTKELYLYNIFISSKEFLDEYATWLFDILGTLESEIQPEVEKRDTFQQRVYGFLSERLFTVYVEYKKKQGYKIKEVPVVYCETNKKRFDIFQFRTKIYKIITKLGIRRPHWREQYGV